jgi:hypothetical protein
MESYYGVQSPRKIEAGEVRASSMTLYSRHRRSEWGFLNMNTPKGPTPPVFRLTNARQTKGSHQCNHRAIK